VKYLILITDGASDTPVPDLDGRTALEAARTPCLDEMARSGAVGLAQTVPEGLEPSSAVACMSVMGFDPVQYYAGRGPIEAMAMGIELDAGQVAMRCNFVTVLDGVMASYSAGNISSAEATELISAVQCSLGTERLRFYPGVGFRGILTVRDGSDLLVTEFVAPHDLTDQPVVDADPMGPGADLVLELMEKSRLYWPITP
jgi:2,3-bisphosphoglycerate-independent phosphoglycerate mutase